MCCICQVCCRGLTRNPVIYASIHLIVAVIRMIVVLCYAVPYHHCEASETFHHGSLINYQRLNCSKYDQIVVDNAIIISNKFDMTQVTTVWLVLDSCMVVACILLLVGICINFKSCFSAFFFLPFIAMTGFLLFVDIVLMIVWTTAYEHHSSGSYFYQMLGYYDKESHLLLKEILGVEDDNYIVTLTRMKVSHLFYRIIYQALTLCFLIVAIKRFFVELCGNKKGEPKDQS